VTSVFQLAIHRRACSPNSTRPAFGATNSTRPAFGAT
jgi:hypothetical protein